jgi:adenylate kinase
MGPPGSGKGTQAMILAREFELEHLSTGEILRSEIASGSDLGKRVSEIVSSGRLVADELVAEIVSSRLTGEHGFILDGFPRTVAQAEILEGMLKERGIEVTKVVEFELDIEELRTRIQKRSLEEGRNDDDLQVFENRMKTFLEGKDALVAFYEQRNLLVRIDALGTKEEVTASLRSLLA